MRTGRLAAAAALGGALLLLTGCMCVLAPETPQLNVTGPASITVGESAQFEAYTVGVATAIGGRANEKRVTPETKWSIKSGGSGASIDARGGFTATRPGSYVVKGDHGGQSATAKIEVRADGTGDAKSDEDTLFSKDAPEPADPATLEMYLLAGNGMAVVNGGKPVTFTLKQPIRVREIVTYHYNDGSGASPGTITISGPDGTVEYEVTRTNPGQGDVPNAYWVADVDMEFAPGRYTLSDSDPGTWSTNEDCGGLGMAWFMVPKGQGTP